MSRPRPCRAVAYLPLGDGRRLVLRRAAAVTDSGLDGFRERAAADGLSVDSWRLQPIPEVEALLVEPATAEPAQR